MDTKPTHLKSARSPTNISFVRTRITLSMPPRSANLLCETHFAFARKELTLAFAPSAIGGRPVLIYTQMERIQTSHLVMGSPAKAPEDGPFCFLPVAFPSLPLWGLSDRLRLLWCAMELPALLVVRKRHCHDTTQVCQGKG